MLTNPFARRRFASSTVVGTAGFTDVPGRARIAPPEPGPTLSMLVAPAPFYEFTQGDLFDPGTMAWAFMPAYETPLNTTWGHGFALLDQPKTSHVFGPIQTYSRPTTVQWFPRGMPANQFLGNTSLQIDFTTGQIVANPVDPSVGVAPAWATAGTSELPWGGSGDFGMPPLSLTPPAGMSFGYTGDSGVDGITGE